MTMKRTLLTFCAIVLVLAFWPWLGNPFAYVHLADSLKTSIPLALIFGEPCARYEGNITSYDEGPSCYRFDPPREYEGLWLYQFEGSRFLENVAIVPKTETEELQLRKGKNVWLRYHPRNGLDLKHLNGDDNSNCTPVYPFAVRFIGKRNPNPGGHMGLWDEVIWVDEMLEIKALPQPNCETFHDYDFEVAE